jgi:hypothetical protein
MSRDKLDLTGVKLGTHRPELGKPEVLAVLWASLEKAEDEDFAKYDHSQSVITEQMWPYTNFPRKSGTSPSACRDRSARK